MKIIKVENYEEMSRKAADIISSEMILNESTVLGLATGSTPIGMYKELIKDFKEGKIDFEKAKSFNLDEYVGLEKNDTNSYRYYMEENLFSHINIPKENTNIPDGTAENLESECKEYEERIAADGGIDIQVLGIGRNGHIGFNEPNGEFQCETHIVDLDEKTINDNARFFDSIEKVPRKAVSMGIKTIMKSRKILLLASGEEKAEAIYKTVNDQIDPSIPASILKLHSNVTIIVDEGAGKLI